MIGFGVRVIVTVRCRHERNVLAKKVGRIVATGLVHRSQKNTCAEQIQSVVATSQIMVVVSVGLAPMMFLVMEDNATDHIPHLRATAWTSRARKRQDRIGVIVFGILIVVQDAKIATQGRHVVVPVSWHRERIADKHPPQCASQSLVPI